jgi:hypothetical protein
MEGVAVYDSKDLQKGYNPAYFQMESYHELQKLAHSQREGIGVGQVVEEKEAAQLTFKFLVLLICHPSKDPNLKC